jgi:hypothetical protein
VRIVGRAICGDAAGIRATTWSRFLQQRLQHHVLAPAYGKTRAVLLAQRADLGVTVLALNSTAFVTVAMIEAFPALGHFILPSFAAMTP